MSDGTTRSAAERIRRSLDELRAARSELVDLSKPGQAMAVAHVVGELEALLRAIDPMAARAYPGPSEQ